MILNPYLSFNGDCETAFNFYAKVLSAEILAMIKLADTPMAASSPAAAQNMIVHARLQVGGTLLMGGDAWVGAYDVPKGFSVTIGIVTPEEAERVFNALAEGGTVSMPLQQTFWARSFGMLVDRFGIPWMINCETPA